jgi:hypothetical protein
MSLGAIVTPPEAHHVNQTLTAINTHGLKDRYEVKSIKPDH